MDLENCTHCAYCPITHTIIDYFNPDTQRLIITGESLSDCQKRYPDVEIWPIDDALTHYAESFKSPPQVISKQVFMERLECMPPAGWVNFGDSESFKMCEMLAYTITGIYARIGDIYYYLADDITLKHSDIIKKIQESEVCTKVSQRG